MKEKKHYKENQHYVPVVYLNNFAREVIRGSKTKYYFSVYDCAKREPLPNNPNVQTKTQAFGKHLYDNKIKDIQEMYARHNLSIEINEVKKLHDEEQTVENYFAKAVEGKLFKSVKEVISLYESTENLTAGEEHKQPFSDDRKSACALYMAFQSLRTPQVFDMIHKTLTKTDTRPIPDIAVATGVVKDMMICGVGYAFIGQDTSQFTLFNEPLMTKQVNLALLVDEEFVTGMANMLLSMYDWYVAVADEGSFFYTSDNPIIRFPKAERAAFFECNKIIFPISERLAIYLTNNKKYKESVETAEENNYIFLSKKETDEFNFLICGYADRFIYSKVNDFKFVENITFILKHINSLTKEPAQLELVLKNWIPDFIRAFDTL